MSCFSISLEILEFSWKWSFSQKSDMLIFLVANKWRMCEKDHMTVYLIGLFAIVFVRMPFIIRIILLRISSFIFGSILGEIGQD